MYLKLNLQTPMQDIREFYLLSTLNAEIKICFNIICIKYIDYYLIIGMIVTQIIKYIKY